MINQVLGYATFPVLTGLGDDMSLAEVDKLEAMTGLILAEWNDGQKLTKEEYRNYLLRTHCIYQLVPGDMNDIYPASIHLPQLMTTYFERFKGGRPALVTRSYKILVRDAEKRYSGKKGEHDGALKSATYDKDAKVMRFNAVSGEFPANQEASTVLPTSRAGFTDLLDVREYHDEEYSCHLIRGKDDSEWQEVLKQKSVTGGTPFWIQPSAPQEAIQWREDWRPIGWSLYTRILQIERIETIRATRAENVQDHIIARMPPDQAEAVAKLRAGGYTPTLHGGVNFIPLPAEEVQFWSQMPDPDLKERSNELKAELEAAIASWLYPATEQTISQANVGTAQIGMQVVHQQESGLLGNRTIALAECAKMMLHMMSDEYLSNRDFWAKTETLYGKLGAKKLEPGQGLHVPAELLKKLKVYGQDANVRVEVVTRSETESELEQREAGVWNNVQRGSQTFDEFIAVRNPDVTGQLEALADDAVRRALATQYDAAIPVIAAKRNLEEWGVDIDRLMQPAMPGAVPGQPQQGQPGQGGGGTTVTQGMPATGGTDVGSAGAMPAGSAQGG